MVIYVLLTTIYFNHYVNSYLPILLSMYIQSILCTSRGPNWFKTLSLQNRGGPRLEVKNGRKGQKILANQWTQLEWKMSLKHRSKKKLNQKVIDPERIRTSNLLIRSQTRYPLRHGTLLLKQVNCFVYKLQWCCNSLNT